MKLLGIPIPDRRTRAARRLAWFIAISADAVQFLAMPLFGEGLFSPINDALDVIVSVMFFVLLGWHPALMPALLAELIPGVDLVPTWTAAVFLATRGMKDTPAAASAPDSASGASRAEVIETPPELPPRARGEAPRD